MQILKIEYKKIFDTDTFKHLSSYLNKISEIENMCHSLINNGQFVHYR